MGDSLIEWTDKSWSPTSGCAKVSEGCRHCFAERMATRFAGGKQFPNGFAVTLHPERLEQPLHWRTPRRVFVCPTGDLFHDDVPDRFIDLVFAVMALTGRHTYQVLTKRADRMAKYMRDPETPKRIAQLTWVEWSKRIDAWVTTLAEWSRNGVPWPLPNVWLGVTAENQEMADRRIPLLLQAPAAVRFVSVEPILSAVNLTPWLTPCDEADNEDGRRVSIPEIPALSWVIVGCESGPNARPMPVAWARSLKDQCVEAGVPLFLKRLLAKGASVPELDGCQRSTIAAHGPIGSNEIGSAAKRILGVVAENLLAALRERVD